MPAAAVKAIPNILSSLRLALAIAFPFLPGGWRLPAIIIGGLSDWIDGLVARRYKATTSTGALLDAVADKAFTLSVLVTIVISGLLQPWQAIVILSRDLVVAAIACYALVIGRFDGFRHMRPRLPGKITTSAVFIWFVALLAGAPQWLDWALFILAAGASSLAGFDYLLQFLRRPPELRGREKRSMVPSPR